MVPESVTSTRSACPHCKAQLVTSKPGGRGAVRAHVMPSRNASWHGTCPASVPVLVGGPRIGAGSWPSSSHSWAREAANTNALTYLIRPTFSVPLPTGSAPVALSPLPPESQLPVGGCASSPAALPRPDPASRAAAPALGTWDFMPPFTWSLSWGCLCSTSSERSSGSTYCRGLGMVRASHVFEAPYHGGFGDLPTKLGVRSCWEDVIVFMGLGKQPLSVLECPCTSYHMYLKCQTVYGHLLCFTFVCVLLRMMRWRWTR